jgi:hypothetical protein
MKTIYKYPVKITGEFDIGMPKDSKILYVAMQNGSPYMWVLVDPDATHETRTFSIVGTGNPAAHVEVENYIGTFQQYQFVWHLFEIK